MTTKQLYEYTLAELNKSKSPPLLVEDYNYFINKTILQYINKIYNLFEIDQQRTDDLRVLKSSAMLQTFLPSDGDDTVVKLPDDYLHILNCVVEYVFEANNKCSIKGSELIKGAKRLTSDMASQIMNNYYLKPTYKNPYYYISNLINKDSFPILDDPEPIVSQLTSNKVVSIELPSTPGGTITINNNGIIYILNYKSPVVSKFDFTDANSLYNLLLNLNISATLIKSNMVALYDVGFENISTTNTQIIITSGLSPQKQQDLINKQPDYRYGNSSKVKMSIKYGVTSKVKISKVFIDYIRSPKFIKLTQEQIDNVTDNSQILEFPDYVCHEILRDLVHSLLENASDPRLQTHIPISQSIATQQQSR